MHASIVSLLLSAPLVLAFPALRNSQAPESAQITLRTGDGDSSVGFSIIVNQLVPSTAQNGKGVKADVATAGVFCQAFSDAQGARKLGDVFTSANSASFTAASDGGTGSTADQAVAIGAYCCVTDEKNFGSCSSSTATTPPPSTTTAVSTPAQSTTPASTGTGKTVRVQFNGLSEKSGQADIPADDSTVLVKSAGSLFEDVLSASIVSADGVVNPSCEAYSDSTGLVASKIGDRFGLGGETLAAGATTVKVVALRCRSN